MGIGTKRSIAALIDYLLCVVLGACIYESHIFKYSLVILIYILYHFIFDLLGRSPGKKLMGLAYVIKSKRSKAVIALVHSILKFLLLPFFIFMVPICCQRKGTLFYDDWMGIHLEEK